MTNNAERELLPCPFCGWQFVRIRDTDEGIFAECCDDKCHAHGPWERNEQKAVAAWNKRAQASGVPDEKVYGDYEADQGGYIDAYPSGHMDGWNACRDAMLKASPSPPKSASVPVERLEEFMAEHPEAYGLAQLIAEYKA
jgi:Lar family restriction alleviation protein